MNYIGDETFCKVIPLVLNSEGRYSNNARDRGGPTMYGVAWNFNAGWVKANTNIQKPTDILRLTLDQARQCYYEKYWLLSGANGITDVDLAYIHLDTAVNCGTGTAAKMLNKLSKNPRYFSGSGGANREMFLQLFLEYLAQRITFYTHARDRDVFLAGWLNRIVDVIHNSFKIE